MSDSDENQATFDSELAARLRGEWFHLLDSSLERIRHCTGQLSEEQIWWRPDPDMNSVGVLIRHLAGNLQQWVVTGITEAADNRDRAAEFESADQESAEQLLSLLCQTVDSAKRVIGDLQPGDLLQSRRIQGFEPTVLGAVMHSLPHFTGHTHQIVQLTRMQLGSRYRYHWTPETPRGSVPI